MHGAVSNHHGLNAAQTRNRIHFYENWHIELAQAHIPEAREAAYVMVYHRLCEVPHDHLYTLRTIAIMCLADTAPFMMLCHSLREPEFVDPKKRELCTTVQIAMKAA